VIITRPAGGRHTRSAGAGCTLTGCTLTGCTLTGRTLTGCTLTGCTLTGRALAGRTVAGCVPPAAFPGDFPTTRPLNSQGC